MIRKLLPSSLKLQIRIVQRRMSDWKNRNALAIARSKVDINGTLQFSVDQVIKRTSLFENKVHNIQLAAQQVAAITILPGEVFSFWETVGNPSEANGYKTGRNIVNGQLKEAIGGGLCQLSGIIYHTSLLAGLTIVERYNHTVDIYKEEDRFTPLGADATVVYGYKDLRVKNQLAVPIRFTFSFQPEQITCGIQSERSILPKQLRFQRNELTSRREVVTFDENTEEILAKSSYLI